jgi:flagellin-specific chaperone FliS
LASRGAAKSYLINQIESLSNLERLIIVYDVAVKAAIDKDRAKVLEAISVLRFSINETPNPKLSKHLSNIYDQIDLELRESKNVDWLEIKDNLSSIRNAWTHVPN